MNKSEISKEINCIFELVDGCC